MIFSLLSTSINWENAHHITPLQLIYSWSSILLSCMFFLPRDLFLVGTCLPIARLALGSLGSLRSRLRLLLGFLGSEARTMGSYHSPTGLDGGKMVGSRWEVQNRFYLLRFIALFIHLFVCMIVSSEKMIGKMWFVEWTKPICPSTLFQNIPMKMEEPLCIAKCDSAPDFAKWTWRISGNLGSEIIIWHQVMASRVVRFFLKLGANLWVSTLNPTGFVQSHRKWCHDDELQ